MQWRDFAKFLMFGVGLATTRDSTPTKAIPVIKFFDPTPDTPRSFGFKVCWFAIQTSNPKLIFEALELGEPTQANWASGVAAAFGGHPHPAYAGWVFVSPPLNGWVLVLHSSFPYPVAAGLRHSEIGEKFNVLFSRLATRFANVQFFGSHRVVGFAAWALAANGQITRVFSYCERTLENFGDQTAEEVILHFINLDGLPPDGADTKFLAESEKYFADETALVAAGLKHQEAAERMQQSGRKTIPDEEDVIRLAALWSIDPTRISDQRYPASAGWVAPLPTSFSA